MKVISRLLNIKLISRIAIWIAISIFIQVIVLAYLNFTYLPGRNKVNDVILKSQEETIKSKRIVIPRDADKIKVSYNGKYVAYLYKDKLKIMDVYNKKIIKTLSYHGREFSYYKWLHDRNMFIYSLEPLEESPGLIEIFTYDMDWDILRKYPDIEGLDKNSRIEEIALSPLTNIIYMKIKSSTDAKIYKFDIMDNLSFIMNVEQSAVIKKAYYSDSLVIQDDSYKLHIWDGKEKHTLKTPIDDKVVLLALDERDNVFIGQVDSEGRVCKILAGELNPKEDINWKEIKLDYFIKSSVIYITTEGRIYTVEDEKNTVYDVTENSIHSYKGDFIEILDRYIISRKGRHLIFETM